MQPWSDSGLANVPHLKWGSHLAHFFGGEDELGELLVPYFQAGLANNERCLWVAGAPFDADRARAALRVAVADLDKRERDGQIEIVDGDLWYSEDEAVQPDALIADLLQRERDAVEQGYAGLRTNGNCAWVSKEQWPAFLDYEELVQEAVRGRRMICLCSYCADDLPDGAQREVMERHDMAITPVRRARQDRTSAPSPGSVSLETLERERRRFHLAMAASQMGTWRYTIADNICVYDENAQRLYGLSEARFLHDDEGVRAKFHPDDLELMWARVAAALEPRGDGRYDVDYRVKQPDGSWRWLSAWGLVEFEGEGLARQAVAITGASRDLTDLKQAEELQRLLLKELEHRIKNTLATVQAISGQTLRGATDLSSAQEALERRIIAMANAHDLLTAKAWTGATLEDVTARVLDAFAQGQIITSGPTVEISPEQTLALSLALHELATNATKYGSLSCAEGRVDISWHVEAGKLHLSWRERGGPPVAPPTRKGFGSRLLERLLVRDLSGSVKLEFDPAGLQFDLVAKL
ncbi:MAG: hypothetical protein JWN66_1208 [Sphingomonas bacterium]|uniref:sensor histidine kinase n=1 Tax=Sphingomonas bacterium TaxID=1895847 RepID=UPI002608978A|nr:MEDS domain-containing protein [Sphingomonas bacterium]MDB5704092.1 hypothetical protein [Sphingomonas bacterium]